MLFSRNPRLRTLSKIYGYFLVIGSGCFSILRKSKVYEDKEYIISSAKREVELLQRGESSLSMWMKMMEKARVNKLSTSSMNSEMKEAVDFVNRRKEEKEKVISDELFARYKLERSIWRKYNSKHL